MYICSEHSSTVFAVNKEMKTVQVLNLKSDGVGLKCAKANDVFDYHTVCDDV